MGSFQAYGDVIKELDDSGYVQDEVPNKSSAENGKLVHLLDFSDDVLLSILNHCGPSDLKALGFTCTRLAALIRDRTLWQRVDIRDTPYGRRRLRWLLEHALHAGTTKLMLKGFAAECAGCQGHVNKPRNEVEANNGDSPDKPDTSPKPGASTSNRTNQIRVEITPGISGVGRAHTHTFTRECFPLSRPSIMPSWPEDDPPPRAAPGDAPPTRCPGPQFTLTPCLLRQLTVQCNLTELALEYCNINCSNISLSQFPPGLKLLSLRGAKCFNMSVDKSFLFKIQDHLPILEHLDLSECAWLEPSCMMCLSKMKCLRKLLMTNCPRMTEFVAYASLACRYGFKKLQIFDLRGSPIGDSEASAMGWLPELEELYLSAFRAPGLATPAKDTTHYHYQHDVLVKAQELSDWELNEPEYFKAISQHRYKRGKGRSKEKCLHGIPFNKCTDGFSDQNTRQRNCDMKRKAILGESSGPSKRKKTELYESSDEDDDDDDEEEDMNDDESNGEETNPKNCGNVAKNGENAAKNLENAAKNGENAAKNEGNAPKNGEINNESHNEEGNAHENNEESNNGEVNNVENMNDDRENDENMDDDLIEDIDMDEVDENGERIINIRVNIDNILPRVGRNIVNFGYAYDGRENIIDMNVGNIPPERVDDENIPRGPIYVENIRHGHIHVENVNNDLANFENIRNNRMDIENLNNDGVNVEHLNNGEVNAGQANEEGMQDIHVEQVNLEMPDGTIYYPRNGRIYVKHRNSDGEEISDSEQEFDEDSDNEAEAVVYSDNEAEAVEHLNNGAAANENLNNEEAANENLNNEAAANENLNNEAAANENLNNEEAPNENLNNEEAAVVNLNNEPEAVENLNNGAVANENLNNEAAANENLNNEAAANENLNNEAAANENLNNEAVAAENRNNEAAAVENLDNERANNENLDNGQENNKNRNEQNQEANGGMVYENRFEVNVQNVEVRPRSHVIFVNVGHQLNPIYRLAIPNEPGANNDFRRNMGLEERRMAAHVPNTLITDSGIRSFGRSDEVRYQIGGPPDPKNCRPDKSNLKILSVQGYKNITDRSLNHLVIAAPKLDLIDFSQTNVTVDGVERFKVMRPEVEVVYSRFEPEPLKFEVHGDDDN